MSSRFDNCSNKQLIILFLFRNSSLKNSVWSCSCLTSLSYMSCVLSTIFDSNNSSLNLFTSEKNACLSQSKSSMIPDLNKLNFFANLILFWSTLSSLICQDSFGRDKHSRLTITLRLTEWLSIIEFKFSLNASLVISLLRESFTNL